MPQEIRVVKCYKCLIFQADGVKKAKRWVCKLCGEKQTLRQEYGRGTGRECRLHVQNLNLNIKKQDEVLGDIINRSYENDNKINSRLSQQSYEDTDIAVCNNSKWSNFINEELRHDNHINNDDILLTESTKSNLKHNRKENCVTVSTSKDTSKNNNVNNISNSKWEQYCSVENDDNNEYDLELSQLTELQEI